jgi:hypothetical protein
VAALGAGGSGAAASGSAGATVGTVSASPAVSVRAVSVGVRSCAFVPKSSTVISMTVGAAGGAGAGAVVARPAGSTDVSKDRKAVASVISPGRHSVRWCRRTD